MTPLRACAAWLVLFAAAFTNGAFREFVLRRWLGELHSHQISSLLGALLMMILIFAFARRWPFASARLAWLTGFAWLFTTIAWEFVFGRWIMERPWDELLAHYALWRGRLWLLVLASILLSPPLAFRLNARPGAARRIPH